MTYILSFIVAFGVTAIAGQILIPVLRRLKAGQSIREDGPTWHMSKQGTPTMGGLMFIIAIAAAVLTVGWSDIAAGYRGGLFVFLFALVFGIIGYVDDYCKVKKKQNTGLTAPQKFLLQLAAAIAAELVALGPGRGYLPEYRARSLVLGHWLTVHGPQGSFAAKALRIDNEGRLVVQLPGGGVQALRAGEVSVRPAPLLAK